MIRMVLLSLLLAQSAEARQWYDEHLLPEESVYSDINLRIAVTQKRGSKDYENYKDYEENVVRVFFDSFNHDVVARVIVYPSFEPEYATALKIVDGEYKIFHLQPSVQLLHFEELEALKENSDQTSQNEKLIEYLQFLEFKEIVLPETREEVEVRQCELPISNGLGSQLYNLWSEMLFRTRFPDLRPATPEAKPAFINFGIHGTRYHFSFEYPGFTLAGNIRSPRPESNTGQFVQISSLMKEACETDDNTDILAELERRVDKLSTKLTETDY